jgi:hypothetical protein
MSLCGEPDKPEVKKHIEDLDSAWDNVTALYAKREENLIDAMEKAMEFHETLQVMIMTVIGSYSINKVRVQVPSSLHSKVHFAVSDFFFLLYSLVE